MHVPRSVLVSAHTFKKGKTFFELLNFQKKSNIPSNGITFTINLVLDVWDYW